MAGWHASRLRDRERFSSLPDTTGSVAARPWVVRVAEGACSPAHHDTAVVRRHTSLKGVPKSGDDLRPTAAVKAGAVRPHYALASPRAPELPAEGCQKEGAYVGAAGASARGVGDMSLGGGFPQPVKIPKRGPAGQIPLVDPPGPRAARARRRRPRAKRRGSQGKAPCWVGGAARRALGVFSATLV